MLGGGAGGIQGPQTRQTLEAMKEVGKDTAQEVKQEQKAAEKSAQASNAQTVFRPKTKTKKKKIKDVSSNVAKMAKMKKEKKLLPVQQIAKKAEEHEKKNPELKSQVLKLLRERVKPDSSSEDIQEILDEFYPDPTLADDAMEFLLDTTEGELHQQVKEAKEELNEEKGREITAGRNISKQARSASEKDGLGTPSSLRDMYRDVTGNPRDSNTMFQELSEKYAFKEMHKVVKFLLHSLGSDMKSKGPSIPKGELHRLMTETRSLQAILGVYRFFKTRMGLMQKMFEKSGLDMPKKLNFELMSKCFMNLAGERYPSSDKVLAQAKRLGIDDWLLAKIIAFSQFRDSIKEMAMSQIYRSLQHRDELLFAIIEALEDLEDQLEEYEDEQEEEGEDWDEEYEEEED